MRTKSWTGYALSEKQQEAFDVNSQSANYIYNTVKENEFPVKCIILPSTTRVYKGLFGNDSDCLESGDYQYDPQDIVFNIGSPQSYHVGDIVRMLTEIMGKTCEPVYEEASFGAERRLSVRKVEETFGIRAATDIRKGGETDREHYDVRTFFTIGKFLAFLQEQAPCALVDVDLVVWKSLNRILRGKEAAFTHWEEPDVSSLWYCGPEKLSTRPGYQFHPEWDFAQIAANTSFIYFKEDWLKEYYVECALEYMYDNFVRTPTKENPELIFVEQRLLTMCCKERQVMERVAAHGHHLERQRGEADSGKENAEGVAVFWMGQRMPCDAHLDRQADD